MRRKLVPRRRARCVGRSDCARHERTNERTLASTAYRLPSMRHKWRLRPRRRRSATRIGWGYVFWRVGHTFTVLCRSRPDGTFTVLLRISGSTFTVLLQRPIFASARCARRAHRHRSQPHYIQDGCRETKPHTLRHPFRRVGCGYHARLATPRALITLDTSFDSPQLGPLQHVRHAGQHMSLAAKLLRSAHRLRQLSQGMAGQAYRHHW